MHKLATSEMILLLQLQLNIFGYSSICNYKIIRLSSFSCAIGICYKTQAHNHSTSSNYLNKFKLHYCTNWSTIICKAYSHY